ncbi:MAG: hypothetical protein CMN57_00725 [Gammaproteobacteria bacterium]|nr:hypothetical protein [Gammaproteobacteria bacterium]
MTTTAASLPAGDEAPLRDVYLSSTRQRFKNEVNRLTRDGGMAALLQGREEADDLAFVLAWVYLYHWLAHNVPAAWREPVVARFRSGGRAFLMDLLLEPDVESFLRGYVAHWQPLPSGGVRPPTQQQQLQRLLAARGGDPAVLVADLLEIWRGLDLFSRSYKVAYSEIGRAERDRYGEMLAEADRARLALVDALPDPGFAGERPRLAKAGLIPAMGCPQTCRHCMFIWRPPKPKNADPERLYRLVDALADNVLFTGGDLTRQLDSFHAAIRSMPNITSFAILLNGDFADDPGVTDAVLGAMAEAIDSRPADWARAKVLLQISFDEFHQEVIVDKRGRLKERIPVAKIANIVERVPQYSEQIQLALLHKQTALNFSMDVFNKGVFARLAAELGRRGHRVQVLSAAPAARPKRNPMAPDQLAPVVKDASFILTRHPDTPILFTSSTIDGYGRAAEMDAWETVKEKELLAEVLAGRTPPGVSFDIDLMFWFNGWATLFNAVHICLGDIYADGEEIVLARQRKDPLSHALHRFDTRLLDYYRELRPDLEQKIAAATGPHHLFHTMTEDADVRLHLTRRLIDDGHGVAAGH